MSIDFYTISIVLTMGLSIGGTYLISKFIQPGWTRAVILNASFVGLFLGAIVLSNSIADFVTGPHPSGAPNALELLAGFSVFLIIPLVFLISATITFILVTQANQLKKVEGQNH